jgi:hypothetical protein
LIAQNILGILAHRADVAASQERCLHHIIKSAPAP